MKQIFLLTILLLMFCFVHSQTVHQLTSKEKISLRGLSVVNNDIIWASGSNGQVAKSTNCGKDFTWITVKGYEKRDFRDVEAFDSNTALIMAVDIPAIILKTNDGGKTWNEVFHDDTKGMFLDAMDFTKDGNGIVVGDPINNKLFIATTSSYGDKWLALKPENNFYTVDTGEAFFAASGTNVNIKGNKNNHVICFVTGGSDSRLIFNGQPLALNILKGKDSQGANSIAVNTSVSRIVITGGDFNEPASSEKNIEVFNIKNGQLLYPVVQTPPHGYRSCVSFITDDSLVCCGLTGVDISNDGGLNWKLISGESFHVCAKAKKGDAVFLAGKDGRIAKLVKE
jgi:hypothetical protein